MPLLCFALILESLVRGKDVRGYIRVDLWTYILCRSERHSLRRLTVYLAILRFPDS